MTNHLKNCEDSPPKKFRLLIAYDGTEFSGWQIQTGSISIQGLLEEAVFKVTGEQRRVTGAGRTDAGVHAKGQVAHVLICKPIDPFVLKRALNAHLPHDIRILSAQEAPSSFHAQFSAVGKEYHYHICLDEVVLPFDRRYVWHYRKKIDFKLLQKASSLFIGTHDFRGFSNAIGGGLIKQNTTRTLHSLDCLKTQTGLVLKFVGTGFLYKMVRNITGMVMSVASGRTPLSNIEQVFASLDRREAENAAPPEGLFLINVFYKVDQEIPPI